MNNDQHIISLTPQQFEFEVKKILDAAGVSLTAYGSSHLESMAGTDGNYIIDLVARFTALGAEFVVFVECKHTSRRVERQDVQILHDKIRSTGVHKGMLFSTAGFQSGAIEYATKHGIALVQLIDGNSNWSTRMTGETAPPPPWATVPKYIGWWYYANRRCLVSSDYNEYTLKALGLKEVD